MPISTGTTLHRATAAIRQTLETPAARLCATWRVTLLSVWVTPSRTTPLSAQSTSKVRFASETSALPVNAAIRWTAVSKSPKLPKGFATASQRALQAVQAASSGEEI